MKIPNKNIILTKYTNRENWLKGRHKAVGASDVSTLFGLNSFTNVVELFWNKVRLTPSTPQNINSISGEIMEPMIAKYFSHYDPQKPTDEELVKNIDANIKLRKIQRFKRNIVMTDLPLSCTLDYVSPSEKAVVECKNLLGFVVSRYENGIIPGHLLQVNAQLLVTGLSRGYLCYMLDGRFYREWDVEANESIQEEIRKKVTEFWDRVTKAREIWNDPTRTDADKMLTIYDNSLEPEITADAGDSLTQFMNTRAIEIKQEARMAITPSIHVLVDGYKTERDFEGVHEKEKTRFGNELRALMIANSVGEITTADGKALVSYRPNAKGTFVLKVN